VREPPAPAPGGGAETPFDWHAHWYPVALEREVDLSRPFPCELLGIRLVLWRDAATGALVCLEDACPHRLAPLSEGRVEGDHIYCAYHGWRFDARGACVEVPSLRGNDTAMSAVCE